MKPTPAAARELRAARHLDAGRDRYKPHSYLAASNGMIVRVEIALTRDYRAFARNLEGFLTQSIERNVMATVLMTLGGWGWEVDVLCASCTDPSTGEIVAAAVRTPPWHMLIAGTLVPSEAAELIEAWLPEDPDLNGISGEPVVTRMIAAAWSERTGGTSTVRHSEAMHILTTVVPPARPAKGDLRLATEGDRELLVSWDGAFSIEANQGGTDDAAPRVDRRLRAGEHYVWDDGGPVSMLAHAPTVGGTARIGPVYTPPEFRNRGYATSAVAALSQLLLDTVADRCMLFADLTNPVSNRIYASVGYVRSGDWELRDLTPPPSQIFLI